MYLILSMDRLAFGRRVRPSDVAALLDRYAPTAIPPDAWPVAVAPAAHATTTN